jgi:hypothetical protein
MIPLDFRQCRSGCCPARLGLKDVFLNEFGEPLNANKGPSIIGPGRSRHLESPIANYYATRDTFITEAIRRGENPLVVAQYCGTSLAMIQGYVGVSGQFNHFSNRNPLTLENMVAGPGFEPGTSRL